MQEGKQGLPLPSNHFSRAYRIVEQQSVLLTLFASLYFTYLMFYYKDHDVAARTKHVMCVNFILEFRDLQLKVHFKRLIFKTLLIEIFS